MATNWTVPRWQQDLRAIARSIRKPDHIDTRPRRIFRPDDGIPSSDPLDVVVQETASEGPLEAVGDHSHRDFYMIYVKRKNYWARLTEPGAATKRTAIKSISGILARRLLNGGIIGIDTTIQRFDYL